MASHAQSQSRWGKDFSRDGVMPGAVLGGTPAPVTVEASPNLAGDGQQVQCPSSPGVATPTAERLHSIEKPDSLDSFKLLVAGGFAGAVSKTATAPLARLTILYQVQGLAYAQSALGPTVLPHKLGLFQAFSEVIRQEGLRALWKGNGVTIVHRLPYSAVNFWSYERCSDLWTRRFPPSKDNPSQDVVRRLAYPLDLVRTRFAAQTTKRYYLGINHALQTIVQEEGVRGLYRGLGATLCQVAPSLAINYTAYGTLRSCWLESNHPYKGLGTVPMSLICGASAGLISSTLTFPLDLVRRRMQLEGQGGQHRYGGYRDVVRSVFRTGGIRGFYAGILPEYYKVCPGVAIGFCTYELCRSAMGVSSSQDFR